MPQYFGPRPFGSTTQRDLSAATVLTGASATVGGTVYTVAVTTAGSTAGSIYDANTTAGNTAANLLAVIPDTVGTYSINMPYNTGLLYEPGTGQVVSIGYDTVTG